MTEEFDLAIVIPTLNEEQGLENTLKSLKSSLEGKFSYFILVVDGRSTDKTVEIAKTKGATVITQRRIGYGDALQVGFHYVDTKLNSKITVMLDADGTYETSDIIKMADIILNGDADFVIGNRFAKMDKNAMTTVNKIGNKTLSAFARMTLGLKVADSQCGLRAFRSDLANIFYTSSMGMPFATEMLSATKMFNIKIKEIPTTYHVRIGETKLTPLQDGSRILSTIVKLLRDTRPLAFFGAIGLILISTGLFLGYEVLSRYIETGIVIKIPTAILTTLLIILGVQSISVGLISDMFKSRIYDKQIFYNEN